MTHKKLWIGWVLICLLMMTYIAYKLFYDTNKSDFIIGEATHGHYQIEMACESCHTESFSGLDGLQQACENCHADELDEAHDSHPKKKFTNPRNADLIDILDARYCVSCHTEHQQEQTKEMGLTLPEDYCFHCHESVGDERPSHVGLGFETCASAGCHNFHDNKALYEDFLVENANESWLKQITKVKERTHARLQSNKPEKQSAFDMSAQINANPEVHQQWLMSKHADANVTCVSCHVSDEVNEAADAWNDKPGIEACQTCHENEVLGFTQGKHGMRLSPALSTPLSPMTPELARQPFHADVAHQELTCNSCHDVHALNTVQAASESCLGCHADEHSLAYEASPHAALWESEVSGDGEQGTGVSCASCHMPRIQEPGFGERTVKVQHNQNWNLRPNEKMIRPVCMQCHSLEFSIDALADKALILNNFKGKPTTHVKSIDWSLKRVKE